MSAAVSLPVLPEPHEIVLKAFPDKTVAYACAECGALYSTVIFGGGPEGLVAARHAAQTHCHHFCACGAPVAINRSTCDTCWSARVKEKQEKVFEAATKVTIEEYEDQPIYWEGPPGGASMSGDGYFLNIEEFLDRCEEEEVEVPPYVWATKPVPLSMDADFLLESALDEHHEGARDEFPDGAELELQKLLDDWCSKQKVKTWDTDYKRAVLLHPKD